MRLTGVRAAYYARLPQGGTDAHRLRALEDVVSEVQIVRAGSEPGWPMRGTHALFRRLGRPLDPQRDNRRIVEAVRTHQPDILWLDKPTRLRPETLTAVRRFSASTRIVCFSGDDYLYPPQSSRYLLESLPLVDLVVTTKRPRVAALRELAGGDVLFVNNSYEPSVHRPHYAIDSPQRTTDVVFVGAFEEQRGAMIEALCSAGVDVSVWGDPRWMRVANRVQSLSYAGGFVADREYAAVLSRAKIGLGFLRKMNGDLQTTRSVEIPACGALLMTERTPDHEELFVEGEEAAFFDSAVDLIAKVKYFLDHEEERQSLATGGYRRVTTEPYTNDATVRTILERLLAGPHAL